MNYYKRHVKDYIAKTAHLSLLEHGVYTRLLDIYYEREQPLTHSEAVRFCRVSTEAEISALDAVLSDFFVLTDGAYVQARVEDEIRIAAEVADINKENGKKGGRPRKAKRNRTETDSVISANRTESETKGNPLIHESTNPLTQERGADAPPPPKSRKRKELTFTQWVESLGGADAIPADDPVFDYAAKVGLPGEFVQLAWAWFDTTYGAGGDRQTKTYADWRAVFRKAVAGGWPKYWGINRQGEYYLTTEGEQARRALA